MQRLARSYALIHGLNVDKFMSVIECETAKTWNTNIQSEYMQDYGREDSWGLVQIHLPHHPHITREQATDPFFALDFMANEWTQGNEWKWSCYNKLFAYE